jgi:hypothetical protein
MMAYILVTCAVQRACASAVGSAHLTHVDGIPRLEKSADLRTRARRELVRQLGDRPGLVSDRADQRRQVVHATHEDGADHDPEEGRHPAEEEAGEDRTDDGARAGDGGEVVAEEDGCAGGHVVDAVALELGGDQPPVVELEAAREIAAVEAVSRREGDGRGDEQEREHTLI